MVHTSDNHNGGVDDNDISQEIYTLEDVIPTDESVFVFITHKTTTAGEASATLAAGVIFSCSKITTTLICYCVVVVAWCYHHIPSPTYGYLSSSVSSSY